MRFQHLVWLEIHPLWWNVGAAEPLAGRHRRTLWWAETNHPDGNNRSAKQKKTQNKAIRFFFFIHKFQITNVHSSSVEITNIENTRKSSKYYVILSY
jgi:hypothetical protein